MIKKRDRQFQTQLRNAIKLAELTQAQAAEYLCISPKTLEGWLSESKTWGRVPHILMQRGALKTLWMRTSNTAIARRKNSKRMLWGIVLPSGKKITTTSLRKFTIDNGLNYSSVIGAANANRKFRGFYFTRETK